MSLRPRLAITLGDPCGIGPEILLRTLGALAAWSVPLVVGSRAGLDLLAASEARPLTWAWHPAALPPPQGFAGQVSALDIQPRPGEVGILPALDIPWLDPVPDLPPGALTLGRGSAASGEATVRAIEAGARLVLAGHADALVTLPMAKAAAHLAGYDIPGHTELLGRLAGAPWTRMAFLSPTLSVVLHTVHQSLRSVIEELDAGAVEATLLHAAEAFSRLSGLGNPRVALCALNPHAGEGGAFGREEAILEEALERARATASAPVFSGPHPSDSLFHRAASGEFDLVVALYHDQGLIPVKLLEPERAVNVTLGLPFIRTSPDHGTAFDKAGRWAARPENFLEAAALAARLATAPAARFPGGRP